MSIIEYMKQLQEKVNKEPDPKKVEIIENELQDIYDYCKEHYGV